jgi:formylmethanofuran dehydrogenase subunit B
VDSLKRCKFGVLVIDPQDCGRRAVEAAHGLATDLNAFTRFYVRALPRPENSVGAEQVLTWQTGFPAAVGLSAGFPRSFGSEFSAEDALARHQADVALLVGDDSLENLSKPAREHLRGIPVVALSSRITSLPTPANVAITTSICANPSGATAFRIDGVALPVRRAYSSSFPDDFQVLQRIETAVRRKR